MSESKPVRVEVETLSVELKEALNQEVTVNVIHLPTGSITTRNVPLKHVYQYTTVAIAQFRDKRDDSALDEHFYIVVINGQNVTTFRHQTKAEPA
jgi:hypothetical protein